MNSSFVDCVAMVTGGSKDAGAATVREFVRRGAKVIAVDIDEAAARKLATSIDSSGDSVVPLACDVADKKQVAAVFEQVSRRFGRLDYLVNMAGPYRPSEPLEQWEFMVTTNLLGTLYACRQAIELMKDQGGSIVNVASDSGLGFGPEQQPGYGAAKAGVIRFTSAMKPLAGTAKIRVNCVVPDWIGTAAVTSWIAKLSEQEKLDNHVPSHVTTNEEFAATILEVASREEFAGRIVLCWSGRPFEVVAYGDRGFQNVEPF